MSPSGSLMSAARLPFVAALFAVLLYLPSLGADFIHDDRLIVFPEGALEAKPLWSAWLDNRWHPGGGAGFYYRPVVYVTHRLDLSGWGRDPAGHHLTNIVLYGAVAALLVQLMLRLGASPGRAAVVTALWIALPAHAENVAWISGRSDLLGALFGLGGYLLLSNGRRAAAALAFLFALWSKETALAYPAALVLASMLSSRQDDRAPWPGPRAALEVVVPPVLVYAVSRRLCEGLQPSVALLPGSAAEAALAAAVALKLLGDYAAMLVLGWDFGPTAYSEMMALRRYGVGTPGSMLARELDLELIASLVAVVALALWIGARVRERGRALAVPALLGALALVVTLRISAQEQLLFGDRYLFIPSQGLAILLALVPFRLPRAALVAAAGVALVWGVRSVERTQRYTSPLVYWSEAVRLNPASPVARNNLAQTLVAQDGASEALAHQEIAFELWRSRDTLAAVVALEMKTGRRAEAEARVRANPALVTPGIRALLSR